MAVVTNDELVNDYGLSSEDIASLEAQADAFDAGEWPRGTVTRIGRPSRVEEPSTPLTFRIRVSKAREVDEKASKLGISRGAALREAVDEWLVHA